MKNTSRRDGTRLQNLGLEYPVPSRTSIRPLINYRMNRIGPDKNGGISTSADARIDTPMRHCCPALLLLLLLLPWRRAAALLCVHVIRSVI